MMEYLTLVRNPRDFFKSVEKEDITTTLKKAAPIVIVLFIILSYLSYFISGKLNNFLGVPNRGFVFYFFMSVVAVSLRILISPGLVKLSLRILKTKSSYSQNLKVLIYNFIPITTISCLIYAIILPIPNLTIQIILFYIFALALFVWHVMLQAVGTSEFYKISVGKAVGAYFLIFGLIFGAMLALIIILVILILFVVLVLKGFK